jgi:hypothetical protein
LYPNVGKKEIKFIHAKYEVQVGCWVGKNGLQAYKIYVIKICMFDEDFFNNISIGSGR